MANLAGVISLAAGLLMWITSLHPIRKNHFELFFYTHHLYVIFVVFFALHVGDPCLSMVVGSIFLFILDRFLRFCQSRNAVDIISASCRPCGTMELILSKPASTYSLHFSLQQGKLLFSYNPFIYNCRSTIQCSEFYLRSSARIILVTMASFQCFL